MSVTVVIPSYKRAAYLKTAIEGVRRQTAISEIDRIIVSENSTDEDARRVCELFPDLNIEYVQQSGEWTAVEHLHWIINQSESVYTAMLHDDDWWYPTHLENALESLKQNDAAAYFSNFVFVKNEIGSGAYFHHPNIFNYFVDDVRFPSKVYFTLQDICAICYLYTPFHMSSMVAKTSFLKSANGSGLKTAKPWYADRILYPYLSLYGKLVFNPQILVGVRIHEKNDGKTINQIDRYSWHAEGSMKIQGFASSNGVDILAKWSKIRDAISIDQFKEIFDMFYLYFGDKNNDMFISERSNLQVDKTPATFKQMIKNILPYGLVSYLSRR